MALLQLAESPYSHLAETPTMSKYIFIPAGMFGQTEDTYVREDFFDGLTDAEYKEVILALAPYQNQGVSEGGPVSTALQFIPGVGPVASKGVDVAKKLIQNRIERVASGKANPILKPDSKIGGFITKAIGGGSIKEKVTGAINKLKDKATAGNEKKIPVDVTGSVGGTTFDITTGQPTEIPFFTKYKTPLLVAGGLAGAFLLYKAFKKK